MSSKLAQISAAGLEIIGYSVGGEETVVAVPALDVCFDIGKCPEAVLPINHVLLSHGHMDHAAGIAYYCSQRDFREMAPGTVLLPKHLAPVVEDLFDVWKRLDGSRPPGKLVGMVPGQEYEIRRNLFAFAFATNHGAGTLGYSIIERRQKLKPEYLELPGPEIARLRQAGVPVTYTLNLPLVTYLGDTMGGEWEKLACVRQSQVLITECTFFDPEHHDRARAGRHFHFDDLARILPEFQNERIIVIHVTRRTDLSLAKKKARETLKPELFAKVQFLMDRRKDF